MIQTYLITIDFQTKLGLETKQEYVNTDKDLFKACCDKEGHICSRKRASQKLLKFIRHDFYAKEDRIIGICLGNKHRYFTF